LAALLLPPAAPAQVSDGKGLTPLEGVVAISDERALWDSVKDSRDANELQAYLAQFPKGLFATVAAIRIRAMGGTPGFLSCWLQTTSTPNEINDLRS
jgi:hypothetical protein